ncbi:MAG TPA: class A beta-lactamase-related serine hydrolase [Pseudomonas xinjiangensis]|uniref:Class A beta-lactamase-related serine hydrolase n=2 Tax=root TaxID=1 RepID=A0A7V1BQT3_9GAMM|nr:class A beta-lactamase-related serine hydrolase [Halopseudomonas xinjiangensis]HEC47172.1 class A beta-lactamase-related serine hydrolase [Halopseudomonas xinjiangensis]
MHWSTFPAATRLWFACSAIVTALFSPALFAEEAGPYKISAQWLERLSEAMQAEVDNGKLAGVATLVYQNGEVVHRDRAGFQNLAEQKPLGEDTLYKIFSLTKPITGAAVLMLYEDGKLNLDDPVEKYLPALKGLEVAKEDGPNGRPITEPAVHPVTIRELMTHTGGFTYGRFSQSQVDTLYVEADVLDPESTLADMVDKLAKIPLRQQPGTLWHYSVSVDIQARLIEVVSGMPFDQFLETRIFQPLEMHDTDFYAPADKAARLATTYRPAEGGLEAVPNTSFLSKPAFLNGGGGLVSSMDDYLRFARMLLNEGELEGTRLLKPETVRMMASNQLPDNVQGPNWAPGNGFGLNVAVVDDPAKAGHLPVGTYWWWGIQGTWMWVDPANQIITLGMLQNTDYQYSRAVHGKVSKILYGPLEN